MIPGGGMSQTGMDIHTMVVLIIFHKAMMIHGNGIRGMVGINHGSTLRMKQGW